VGERVCERVCIHIYRVHILLGVVSAQRLVAESECVRGSVCETEREMCVRECECVCARVYIYI
jgi:hypothetical protein